MGGKPKLGRGARKVYIGQLHTSGFFAKLKRRCDSTRVGLVCLDRGAEPCSRKVPYRLEYRNVSGWHETIRTTWSRQRLSPNGYQSRTRR
jgi:hypothetical protein